MSKPGSVAGSRIEIQYQKGKSIMFRSDHETEGSDLNLKKRR